MWSTLLNVKVKSLTYPAITYPGTTFVKLHLVNNLCSYHNLALLCN